MQRTSMKYLFYTYILATAFLFMGCRGGGGSAGAGTDSASVPGPVDKRSGLIAALKDLRREAASKDSNVIAGMFRFPIPDSSIRISGDSVFEKAKVGGDISRALFLSGYGEFVQELQYPELLEAFRNLDVNKLKTTDSVVYDEKGAKKHCLTGYSIRVMADSLVEVQAWQGTNEGYSGVGREDAECEEFLLTWRFVFDGKRLYMIDHSEAD
jgi:hypothetical protein